MNDLDRQLSRAIQHFWKTRSRQAKAQGARTGRRDAGSRTAVTGGKQLDGFTDLLRDLLVGAGVDGASIFARQRIELPGWFRATKKWDLLIVSKGSLVASVEFKSIVGSFGNNLNNRTEEALGNATDLLAAYREGAFQPSVRPWLGYLMLIQDAPEARAAVSVQEPHFKVLDEFREASYIERSRILLTKLVRERLYDAACLLTSPTRTGASKGEYNEPSPELSFRNFAESLVSRAAAHGKFSR